MHNIILKNAFLFCFSRNIFTPNILVSYLCFQICNVQSLALPLLSYSDKEHFLLQYVWVHTVLASITRIQTLQSHQTFVPVWLVSFSNEPVSLTQVGLTCEMLLSNRVPLIVCLLCGRDQRPVHTISMLQGGYQILCWRPGLFHMCVQSRLEGATLWERWVLIHHWGFNRFHTHMLTIWSD